MPYLLYQFVNRRPDNNSKEISEHTQAYESIYKPKNLPTGLILQIFFSSNKNLCVH